jgi:hypothetical protein
MGSGGEGPLPWGHGPPRGRGMERTGRKVRFARLIQRPVRVLGVPSARAAFGGNLSRPCCHSRCSQCHRSGGPSSSTHRARTRPPAIAAGPNRHASNATFISWVAKSVMAPAVGPEAKGLARLRAAARADMGSSCALACPGNLLRGCGAPISRGCDAQRPKVQPDGITNYRRPVDRILSALLPGRQAVWACRGRVRAEP